MNRLNGPVPLADPARWMAPFSGWLGYSGREDITRATFEITDDGRIANCEIIWPDPHNALHGALCEHLAGQQRFRAPIFARERRGSYEVSWHEQSGAGR